MNRAEQDVLRVRELMAPANPVPASAFSGGWNDEFGPVSSRQIRLQGPGPADGGVVLDGSGAGESGPVAGVWARRWLVPAATATAVIAIAVGAATLSPRAARPGLAPRGESGTTAGGLGARAGGAGAGRRPQGAGRPGRGQSPVRGGRGPGHG